AGCQRSCNGCRRRSCRRSFQCGHWPGDHVSRVMESPSARVIAGSGKGPVAATMRAAVIVEPRRVEVREAPLPQPAANELRVRVEGCGVCASNIPPWEGRPWFNYPMAPGALGHEGWGYVDAVGREVTAFSVGDRVAMLSQNAYAE